MVVVENWMWWSAIILIFVIIFFRRRFIALWIKRKGSILIELDKLEYSPSETISGKVVLNLKKPIDANSFNIGLVGTQASRSHSNLSNRHSGRMFVKEVFNFKKPLDGKKQYSVGETNYSFQLKIPKDIVKSAVSSSNPAVDNMIKTVQLLGGASSVKWHVYSNLEVEGFDISNRIQINIV